MVKFIRKVILIHLKGEVVESMKKMKLFLEELYSFKDILKEKVLTNPTIGRF